eukprot:541756-Pleurochrysis_carterae.AAC.2
MDAFGSCMCKPRGFGAEETALTHKQFSLREIGMWISQGSRPLACTIDAERNMKSRRPNEL